MKADVLNAEGKKVREIELPLCFSAPIREDLVQKCVEALKRKQPYAPYEMAGKQASASGKIRHGRRKWRTAYGKGISRVPRKIMWRRGDQFYWIAAEISSARKGRRSHPPQILSMIQKKKINKKEMVLALRSALSATAHANYLKRRYGSLEEVKVKLPLIVENLSQKKNKDLGKFLENVLGNLAPLAFKEKSVRAGRGKLRGRKYKKTLGALIVVGSGEGVRMKGVDIKPAKTVGLEDLAKGALGRLTIYTEKAIQELAGRIP